MMKKASRFVEAHVNKSKNGMGDYKGTGVKAKVGKIRSVYPVEYSEMSNKELGKPPKSFA
jgi:hypothetical protein